MNTQGYKEAMAEVLEVLKLVQDEDIKKIPKSFLDLLEENASKTYKVNIDYDKSIKNQDLKAETIAILDLICLNYWCDTEEKKEEFLKTLTKNEKSYQKEIQEKFDIDKILKNRKQRR